MNDVSLSRKDVRGAEPMIDFPPDLLDGWASERSSPSREARPQVDAEEPSDLYRHRLAVTYLLCVFLGYAGTHKFYLRKPRVGRIYLGAGMLGIGGWFFLSGWIAGALFAGFFLILLMLFLALDLLTIPRQVRKSLGATDGKADVPDGQRERHSESNRLISHTSAGRHTGRRSRRLCVGRWIGMFGR